MLRSLVQTQAQDTNQGVSKTDLLKGVREWMGDEYGEPSSVK